jgi:hypothetical protein
MSPARPAPGRPRRRRYQDRRIGGRAQRRAHDHPRNGPFLRRGDAWAVSDLAAAFDSFFGPRLEPARAGSAPVAYQVIEGRQVTVAADESL